MKNWNISELLLLSQRAKDETTKEKQKGPVEKLHKNWKTFLFGRKHHVLISRKSIVGDVYESLEAMRFMHWQLWEYFPVQLDVLLQQAMHKITIINLTTRCNN